MGEHAPSGACSRDQETWGCSETSLASEVAETESGVPWTREAVSPLSDMEPTNKYARLSEPISAEDTITSHDILVPQPEKDDYWREVEWMLRVAGGG